MPSSSHPPLTPYHRSKAIFAKNVLNMMDTVDLRISTAEDAENDLEDEDDFDEADLIAKPKVIVPGRRRVSVSAESIDPSKVKEMIASVAVVAKDVQTQKNLFLLVNKSSLLKKMLDMDERTLIVKAFAGKLPLC